MVGCFKTNGRLEADTPTLPQISTLALPIRLLHMSSSKWGCCLNCTRRDIASAPPRSMNDLGSVGKAVATLPTKASTAAKMSASLLPLLLFARISAFLVAMLVLIWALAFKTSFIRALSLPSSQELFIYAVLHPLLMVIGFIILSGEAILVHRWLRGSRNLKKSVHLGMQGVAFASGVFGIWTKFHGDDGIMANFYSLHSWMGLICVFLFGSQWMMGFLNFWHRGEVRAVRARVLPWHVFLGLYTYGLAVATAETGLLEKLTFLQTNRDLPKHAYESIVVNSLGLGLVMLGSFVILTAVSPRHMYHQNYVPYSNSKANA